MGGVGTGSPPSGGWTHSLGFQGIYLPAACRHSHEVAIAVIVLMFRGGDRGPGLPPRPRVPPPTESVPCFCPFHGPRVGGGSSGGAAEESELPRPLRQAEMCVVPPPWTVDKLSSGREAGWSHAGPGLARHSCCPSLPVGPPPPAPRGLSALFLGLSGLTPGASFPCPPTACHEEAGHLGGPGQASPGQRNPGAGSNREAPSAATPLLAPKPRSLPAPQARDPGAGPRKTFLRSLLLRGHTGGLGAAAPRGPTGLAGPPVGGVWGDVSSVSELGAKGPRGPRPASPKSRRGPRRNVPSPDTARPC